MWKEKKCGLVAERAVGKGPFAECSLQIRSATLGKIFPALVFPTLSSVVARGARQRKFCKKNRKTVFVDGLCQGLLAQVVFKKIEKPSLPTASARGSRHRCFQKKIENRLCRRPVTGALGTGV
jgi:hypothetical protein